MTVSRPVQAGAPPQPASRGGFAGAAAAAAAQTPGDPLTDAIRKLQAEQPEAGASRCPCGNMDCAPPRITVHAATWTVSQCDGVKYLRAISLVAGVGARAAPQR